MAESIKLNGDKYIDATGVYDSAYGKTQNVINDNLSHFEFVSLDVAGTSMTYQLDRGRIYLIIDSHGGGDAYMCFLVDCRTTPKAYRLDNGTYGNVTVSSDCLATITYCSTYHTGSIIRIW